MITENLQAIMDILLYETYDINDLMSDWDTFRNFTDDMYMKLGEGYEHKEFREFPVKYVFEKGGKVYTSQFRHFITLLYFWRPFAGMTSDIREPLDETYILDMTQLSQSYIKSYIDNKIIKPYIRKIPFKRLNILIEDMIYNISFNIVYDYSIPLGLSINLETFMDVANKNPRFNEIIRTKLDESLQPNEIESTIDLLTDETIGILKDTDNFLKPLLKSGSGIKPKQLSEFAISGGLKPDLDGNTIPKPINSNLIVGGLNSVSNYFTDAIAGRKNLILNKTVMGTAGYFSKKIILLNSTHSLSTEERCRSVHPLRIKIGSMNEFRRYIGRNFRIEHDSRDYRILREEDTWVIGKHILLRSPMTCAAKDGICKTCYGDMMYYINRNMNIGVLAATYLCKKLSQDILSSKHILATDSEFISFNDNFYEYFTLSANEIYLKNGLDGDIYDKCFLSIRSEELQEIDDFSVSMFTKFINSYEIIDTINNRVISIKDLEDKNIFLSKELIDVMEIERKRKAVYEIPLSELPDMKLFILEVGNNELTKPLYDIMKLVDNKSGMDILGVSTIEEALQTMVSLTIQSNIKIQSVHVEVILASLIRSKENILYRPDFTKYTAIDDICILTLSGALEKHPSITISMSFQNLSRQLLSALTFKKISTSFVDNLMRI